jgi:hypothetical protein
MRTANLDRYGHKIRLGCFQDLPLDARQRACEWLDRFLGVASSCDWLPGVQAECEEASEARLRDSTGVPRVDTVHFLVSRPVVLLTSMSDD